MTIHHANRGLGISLDKWEALSDSDRSEVVEYRNLEAAHAASLERLYTWLWGAGIGLTLGIGFYRPVATAPVIVLCMVAGAILYSRKKKAQESARERYLAQLPPDLQNTIKWKF